jgi:hypothetical protein
MACFLDLRLEIRRRRLSIMDIIGNVRGSFFCHDGRDISGDYIGKGEKLEANITRTALACLITKWESLVAESSAFTQTVGYGDLCDNDVLAPFWLLKTLGKPLHILH